MVKAVEDQNGRKVELPLSIFQANNPELAKMLVKKQDLNDAKNLSVY